MSVNINQICLCIEPLKKMEEKWKDCNCCCKEYDPNDTEFYYCGFEEDCKFTKISGISYVVCSECFNSPTKNTNESERKLSYDNKHNCISNKIASSLQMISKQMKKLINIQQQKSYMCRIYAYLYLYCIAKLNDDVLVERFNSFYNAQLHRIKKETDLTSLELSDDVFINNKNMDSNKSVKMNEISLEWFALKKEQEFQEDKKENEEEFEMAQFEDTGIGCHDIYKCSIRKRIEYIMKIFRQYFLCKYVYDNKDKLDNDNEMLNYVDIFEAAFQGYTIINLLDDYYHLKTFHFSDDGLIDCKVSISKDDDQQNRQNVSVCVDFLFKKYREKELNDEDIFNVYLHRLDFWQTNIIEITSKIHSFINHYSKEQLQQDTVYKIRSLKWRKDKGKKKHKENYSKFINEIAEKKEPDKRKGLMNDVYDLLHKNGLSGKECIQLMSYLNKNEYDSDSIIEDLCDIDIDPFNHYNESNIFQSCLNYNKYYAKVIKNHFKASHNDNDPITEFSLGPIDIFYYYAHFKDHITQTYIVKPKYSTLKQECLNNNIYAMDINTLHQFINKAYVYINSFKGKSLKACDQGVRNNYYENPVHLNITMSHILVLVMYCNLDVLQKAYKAKGCRQIKYNESLEQIKQRNKEIGHWYGFLFQAIYFYGDKASENSTSVFYTGMNIRVVFNTFTPRFTSPMSTTIQWSVAHQFCKGIGVILKLIPCQGCHDRYFDVEWISDYPQERERLFFLAEKLQVCDIESFDIDDNSRVINAGYVAAFRLFSNIFSGYFFIFKLEHKRQIEKILIMLIRNYCANNVINVETTRINIPIYIQQLFYHLVVSIKNKQVFNFINPTEYYLLSDALKQQLLSFENELNEPVAVKKELTMSAFEISVLKIADYYVFPFADQIFTTLRTIIHQMSNYMPPFQIPGNNEILLVPGVVEYLQALGFKYNEANTLLICDNKASSECVSNAVKSFDIYNPYKIKLSPFLSAFVQIKKIACYQTFIWILYADQVKKLQTGTKDTFIQSQQVFMYRISKNIKAEFKFRIRNNSSDQYTLFGVFIDSLSLQLVNGVFCVAVDELEWFTNGWNFYRLSKGQSKDIRLFEDKFLNIKDLSSLTLRICMYLY